MALVDFGLVSDELALADDMWVMKALVRGSLLNPASNRPGVLVLTDKVLYWGGTPKMMSRFHRVPLKSVTSVNRVGRFIWECVKLTHLDIEGEKSLYICPFKGDCGKPKRDDASISQLIRRLGGGRDGR